MHGRSDSHHMHAHTHCEHSATTADKGCGTIIVVKKGSEDKVFMELWQLHFRDKGLAEISRRRDFIGGSIGECGVGNYVFSLKSRQ